MMCAWQELLSVIPPHLRQEVDTNGKETMQELRLRINAPPEIVLSGRSVWGTRLTEKRDLDYIVNAVTRYSPWAGETMAKGYLTAPGGHRVGVCGEAICKNGVFSGYREIHSLCIRVARDFRGLAENASIKGSAILLGAPGWGKTTLLRDLIRTISEKETVCVIDERKELFPPGFQTGRCMDVLSGCPKQCGIEMVLRTMGPACIAVDEITEAADCAALQKAANCGVRLLATGHASSLEDFLNRKVYRPLIDGEVFQTILILQKDRSFTVERMKL